MQAMTTEDERRLLKAAGLVADRVAGGDHPSTAVADVARDLELPPGHLGLVVSAYNSARSDVQRQTGRDALEKAADFDLADLDEVKKLLYPPAVKTAAVRQRDEAVSDEYSRPPHFARERRKAAGLVKLAALPVPTAPPLPPADHGRASATAINSMRKLAVTEEVLRGEAGTAFDKLAGLLQSLRSYLNTPGSLGVAEVREQSALALGQEAEVLLDRCVAPCPWLTKQSVATPPRPGPIDWNRTPYSLVKAAVDTARAFAAARELFNDFTAQLPNKREELLRPFDGPGQGPGVLPAESLTKASWWLGNIAGSALGTTAAQEMSKIKDTGALEQKTLNKLTSPKHEATFRNLQTESMLHDLMANDEVISGYHPDEVLGHFNAISQLAPRASGQTALMRALLRKQLQQGAMDPYESDLLLKIENSLKQRDDPGYGGGVLGAQRGVM